MIDFWTSSGYRLLTHDESGLRLTDAFLRQFLARPELEPDEESCANERALYAIVMANPRTTVKAATIASIADPNARENWEVWLRFRDHLLRSPTIEAAYLALFTGGHTMLPSLFIDRLAQVILRAILDGCDDALQLRAAEMFFRAQKISITDGAVIAADLALVEGKAMGNLGRWLVEQGAPVKSMSLDVIETSNRAAYLGRDERHDTALAINGARPGAHALCRVMEKWIEHFHRVRVSIIPVPEIPQDSWVWHVGLDAEASRLLNDLYRGIEPGHDELWRLIALFSLSFLEASDARAELAGRPVYLGLAMTSDNVLRLKPQNLLVNLPLARRA
jgi:hypothetical protein